MRLETALDRKSTLSTAMPGRAIKRLQNSIPCYSKQAKICWHFPRSQHISWYEGGIWIFWSHVIRLPNYPVFVQQGTHWDKMHGKHYIFPESYFRWTMIAHQQGGNLPSSYSIPIAYITANDYGLSDCIPLCLTIPNTQCRQQTCNLITLTRQKSLM